MAGKILAANWKMNTIPADGVALVSEILNQWPDNHRAHTIICPPFTHLAFIAELLKNKPSFSLGAQNCHHEKKGAFTGGISVDMLKDLGVEYVIIGHSERRHIFHESEKDITSKVQRVIQAGMHVIFCCGELLKYRKQGLETSIVESQLKSSLGALSDTEMKQVTIAYEPVWAIGTGETASPQQAQNMHKTIRHWISKQWNNDIADKCSILYGGSVKPGNAKALFMQTDVNGGLIGGASLNAQDFKAIYHAMI